MNACARTMVLAVLALAAAQLAPPAAAEPIGVVISNRDYPWDVGVVEYAHNDGWAIYSALSDNWRMGSREGEIHHLRDLTLAKFYEWFGPREGVPGKLARLAHADADVVVFYSGHGAPGLADRAGYLLPVDGNPDMAQYTGYPLDTLKANLEALEARSVVLLIDACFSGLGHSENVVKGISGPVSIIAKPLASESRLSVLTAASGAQVASWDEKNEHGLFTRYLLDALAGAADRPPFGDGDGRLLLSETKAWLDQEMTGAASRLDRDQIAHLSGNAAGVLPMMRKRERLPCPGEPETECVLLEERVLKSEMGNQDLVYREFSPDEYADMTMMEVIAFIHYADRPDDPPLWSDTVSGGINYIQEMSLTQHWPSGYEFLHVKVDYHGSSPYNDAHPGELWVGGQESYRRVAIDFGRDVDKYARENWSEYRDRVESEGEVPLWAMRVDTDNLSGRAWAYNSRGCTRCTFGGVDFKLKLIGRDGEPVLVLDGPPTERID